MKEAHKHEIQKYDVVLCTCSSALKPEILAVMDFRQILIDECAMATEPEAFIPLVSYNPEQVSAGRTSSSSSSSSVFKQNQRDSVKWKRLVPFAAGCLKVWLKLPRSLCSALSHLVQLFGERFHSQYSAIFIIHNAL